MQISSYFKYAGVLLCGALLLFSCSKSNGDDLDNASGEPHTF